MYRLFEKGPILLCQVPHAKFLSTTLIHLDRQKMDIDAEDSPDEAETLAQVHPTATTEYRASEDHKKLNPKQIVHSPSSSWTLYGRQR